MTAEALNAFQHYLLTADSDELSLAYEDACANEEGSRELLLAAELERRGLLV